MKLAVIIPTYRRPRTLRQTLESLQGQSWRDFEILVVDNDADPAIDQLVTDFNQSASIPAVYRAEPRRGVHYARNGAAAATDAVLLLYTDDDMSFDPDWVGAYARAFAGHPEMLAAGGPVRPAWDEPPPRWILDYQGDAREFAILSLLEPFDSFQLSPQGYFYSCNMAIRTDVLKARGGFHPEATGNIWIGDGEAGLNRDMWACRDLIGYVPEAMTYHHIPPSRMTVKYFCHRMANEGASDMYARFHKGIPPWTELLREAITMVLKHAKLWVRAYLVRGRTDLPSLKIQMQAARSQSRLRYLLQLLFNENLRRLVLKQSWFDQ